MVTALSAGARYPVLLGNTFVADLESGAQMRVGYRTAAGTDSMTEAITADADGASYEPETAGQFYVQARADADSDWCPAGVIDCSGLVDAYEETLVARLAELDKLLADPTSLVQYQISDPSGTAATRMTLQSVERERRRLQAELFGHRRRQRGGLPVRNR